jgi:hypothetical protein
MDLSGNEKKIQALYSELRLETENRVPRFKYVWAQAKVVEERPVRSRRMALLVAFSVIAVACSLAVWSWYRSTASPVPTIAQLQPQPAIVESSDPQPTAVVLRPAKPRRQRNHRRRQPQPWSTVAVATLSNWQSPTQLFMQSPTDLVLTSLPQLNQSVKDLESFLPKDHEIMKESNR